jgi:hypothetical protein
MGKEIENKNILCKEEEEKNRKKLAKKRYREKNKLKLRSLQQLYYKRNGTIERVKRIELGGPAQVPTEESPRSQKECVNSNYFQNIKTHTDDGQDTHHKNGVPPIDPSSHHDNVLHSTSHPTQ